MSFNMSMYVYACVYMYVCMFICMYTGGQKFGILTLISLSLKNKLKNKSKNLCLVTFEELGYKDTQKLLRIISISDPQIIFNRLGCAKK